MNGEVQMYTKNEKEPEIYLCIQVVTRNEVMISFDVTHIFLTFCRLLYYEKFYLLPPKKIRPIKEKNYPRYLKRPSDSLRLFACFGVAEPAD